MRTLLLLAVAALIAGCAEGSALIVGDPRAPIEDHTTVEIVTEMPAGAEQIAIVKASSDDGWNQQQSLDLAVAELKKQAAKVGANTVVITRRDTGTSVGSMPNYGPGGGTTTYSSEVEIIEGTAVWVEK